MKDLVQYSLTGLDEILHFVQDDSVGLDEFLRFTQDDNSQLGGKPGGEKKYAQSIGD